jgi:CMP-N-acetylneuraminic acid synthetase
MDNVLAIIPARKGSKTIRDKNLFPLCGVPLIEYTIEACKDAGIDYVITTDDERIRSKYLFTIERPKKLATDTAHIIDEIKRIDANKFLRKDVYMLLQPTSPLRTHEHLQEAIELFEESKSDSLYSGYRLKLKTKDKIYDKHLSQDHFQRNGSIFMAKRELILEGRMWDENVVEYEMPQSLSVDIDTMDEMFIAESMIYNGALDYIYEEE